MSRDDVKLEILPDTPVFQYPPVVDPCSPGNILNGKIRLFLSKSAKVKHIRLQLRGVFRFKSNVPGSYVPAVRELSFYSHQTVVLTHPRPKVFDRGNTDVNWQLAIPDNLPTSFNSQRAEVCWTLSAEVTLANWGILSKDLRAETPFFITRRSLCIDNFPAASSVTIKHEGKLEGRLRFAVRTPRYLALPPEGGLGRLELELKITPLRDRLRLKNIRLDLLEVEEYHIPQRYDDFYPSNTSPQGPPEIPPRTLCIASAGFEGSVKRWQEQAVIGLDVESSDVKEDTYSTFVDVTHYIRITMEFFDCEPPYDLVIPIVSAPTEPSPLSIMPPKDDLYQQQGF